MATTPPTQPDPRTAADDDEDATGDQAPAEGGDNTPPEQPGSPRG